MNWKETHKATFGALLACAALGVPACGDDDGGTDGTGMTENDVTPGNTAASPTGSVSGSNTAPGNPAPNTPTSPANPQPSGPESEPESASAEPEPASAEPEPASTTPVDDTPPAPVSEEALAEACAQAVECEQSTEVECATELGLLTAVIEALCPGAVGPYVECLGSMEGCDPDVACAEESAALDECTQNPPEAEAVSPEIVEMACMTQVRCDPTLEQAECLASFEAVGPLLESQCPGGSEPYITCIAQMTGCDPAAECPEEVAVLEACGLEVNAGL